MSLARRATVPRHVLHSALTRPSSANVRCFKSRQWFVPAAEQLISLSDNNNIHVAHWADHQWNVEWADNPTRLRTFTSDNATHPLEMTFPKRAWLRLNRLRSGVRRFLFCLYRLVMASCECRAEEQTVDHVVFQCPIHRPSGHHWTGRFDVSGWWDNRIVAQHLPRDLVRPSSGLTNWLNWK